MTRNIFYNHNRLVIFKRLCEIFYTTEINVYDTSCT